MIPFSIYGSNTARESSPALREVLIFLVLMVSWMEDPPEVQTEYEVLEFFAGVGRI